MSDIQTPADSSSASYWREAISLVQGTLPMVMVRMAVYVLFFFVTVLWFAFWGLLAWLFSNVAPFMSWIFVIIALGAGGGLVWFARRYMLYMVKGAHIAAMTDLLRGREVPSGFGQLSYGRAIIEKYFRDASMLFGLEMLIDGTLRAMSRTVLNIAGRLPLPSNASGIVKIILSIINRSLSYIDEAILSYAIWREEENVWNSARHGIILYGQSYKPILFTSAKIYLIEKVFFFGLLLLMLIPGYFLMAMASELVVVQVLIFVGIVLAAYLIELALFEPFALAYVMVTYHREIAGKTPDPTWDERLKSVSSSFRKLVDRAKEKMSGQPGAAAPAEAPVAGSTAAGDAVPAPQASPAPPAPAPEAAPAAAPEAAAPDTPPAATGSPEAGTANKSESGS